MKDWNVGSTVTGEKGISRTGARAIRPDSMKS